MRLLLLAGALLVLAGCCYWIVRLMKNHDDSGQGPAGDGPRSSPEQTAAGLGR